MKTFLLFDGRYRIDPDRAVVLTIEHSLKAARRAAIVYGDCVIVERFLDGTTRGWSGCEGRRQSRRWTTRTGPSRRRLYRPSDLTAALRKENTDA